MITEAKEENKRVITDLQDALVQEAQDTSERVKSLKDTVDAQTFKVTTEMTSALAEMLQDYLSSPTIGNTQRDHDGDNTPVNSFSTPDRHASSSPPYLTTCVFPDTHHSH